MRGNNRLCKQTITDGLLYLLNTKRVLPIYSGLSKLLIFLVCQVYSWSQVLEHWMGPNKEHRLEKNYHNPDYAFPDGSEPFVLFTRCIGVSNCYVFKSRLQEYAQKVGLPTPVYETMKEGPSHEPLFKSTVVVNDIRYDSLPGFYNRKAAEQSAAEVALMELAKSSGDQQCISVPVHETGLCKNLLQEYAQKMNYAIPLYDCRKDDAPGKVTLFSCTVEIGGMRYIGAAAKTKKETEIKAARTALLAIQSSPSESAGLSGGNYQLTVLPGKRREIEAIKVQTPTALKPKKARCKKKRTVKQKPNILAETVPTGIQVVGTIHMDMDSEMNPEMELPNISPIVEDLSGAEPLNQVSDVCPEPNEPLLAEPGSIITTHANGELQELNAQSAASIDDQSNHRITDGQTPPVPCGELSNAAICTNAGEASLAKSMEVPSNHRIVNGQTPPVPCDPSNAAICTEDSNVGEAFFAKSMEVPSNNMIADGQTPPAPCDPSNAAICTDDSNVGEAFFAKSMEVPSLDQSGESVQPSAD